MQLHFTKMHGIGNDFIVVDATQQPVSLSPESLQALSDRHFGIGFDQCLVLEPAQTPNADFFYRIYNSDGSEVAQCGNGARCIAHYIRTKGLSDKPEIVVDTHKGQLVLRFTQNNDVIVDMGAPLLQPTEIPLVKDEYADTYKTEVAGEEITFAAVSMGNPHAVLAMKDIHSLDIEAIARPLQASPLFPESANIGFMELLAPDHIKLRVYERGAGETLACGSGACAAVVAGILAGKLQENVKVDLPGGRISVSWRGLGQPVYLTGPAEIVFEGVVEINP